jgi:hypothetical protein
MRRTYTPEELKLLEAKSYTPEEFDKLVAAGKIRVSSRRKNPRPQSLLKV